MVDKKTPFLVVVLCATLVALFLSGGKSNGSVKNSNVGTAKDEVTSILENADDFETLAAAGLGEKPNESLQSPPEEVIDESDQSPGAVRKCSLAKQQAFLADTTILNGFEKRELVEKVCSSLRTHEERQMCRRRGRRMGEQLHKYYGADGPLTIERANAAEKIFAKDPKGRNTRFTVAGGRLVDWKQLKKGGRHVHSQWEHTTIRFLTLFEKEIFSPEQNFDFFIDMIDGCVAREEVPYPLVTYSVSDRCPQTTPLTYSLWYQDGGNLKEPPSRFEDLIPKIFTMGTCVNAHRFGPAALSASGVLPQLEARCLDTKKRWPGRCMEKMRNELQTEEVSALTKPWWNKPGRMCKAIVTNQHRSTDEALKNKYNLVVDGRAAVFRLASRLQATPLVLLWNPTKFKQSFQLDMLPYVHYVPIEPKGIQHLSTALNTSFHWLERNPEIAKSISSEATKWGLLHADRNAFITEWRLYAALMSDMHAPESAQKYQKIAEKSAPIDVSFEPTNKRLHDPDAYFVLRVNDRPFAEWRDRPPAST